MANCRKDQLSAEASACRGSLHCIVFSFILQGILREWRTVGKISCQLRRVCLQRKFILYRIQFYPSRNLKRMANCRKDQLSAEACACRGSLSCIVFSFILQGILREWRTVGKISCLAETFACRGSLSCIVFSFILQGILREWRTVGKISCQLRHVFVEEVSLYRIQFYP